MPLSLVGTFGVMYLLGFSLNNLTLMALTISTGFVVDDAIVMIENIFRYLEQGETPLNAALKGARQIGFTIISLTVSLIAVLIPLLFMGDIVGRLFREFAITLSVTILLSALISLTLTPMMCSRLLKQESEQKQEPFLPGIGTRFQSCNRILRTHLAMGVEARKSHAACRGCDACADPRALRRRAEGTFSGAGHRSYSGHFRSRAEHFFQRDGRETTGVSGCYSEGSRCGKLVVVHRHRWN